MSAPEAATSFLPHDSEGMLAATAALPAHLEAAMAGDYSRFAARADPSVVVVLGMGGSSVAGAVLQALAAPRARVPVVLSSSYDCPSFVGRDSLVVAVSFSGETEETLEAAAAAADRGARLVGITVGGSLAGLVEGAGGEVLAVPPGIPQPRAGIAAMAAPLLLACEAAGVLPGARDDLAGALDQLHERLPGLIEGGGASAELARRIGRTIPIVHGASGLGAVAARRFKTQVTENAKAPAFSGEQPEACHNEICGFGQHGDVTRQVFTLVQFHLAGDHPQVTRRFGIVGELAAEAVGDVVEVTGEGRGPLAGFFDLVAIGDVASLHLAAREEIDPGPVPVLGEIKTRLRSGR